MWDAQGSCSGGVMPTTCLWNWEQRTLWQSLLRLHRVCDLQVAKGWGGMGLSNCCEGWEIGFWRQGHWGVVLFWGSPRSPAVFPLDFSCMIEPHSSYLEVSLLSDQVVAEMMLSFCYCRGLRIEASVSLVSNLGTESERETYLLVATIHKKWLVFGYKQWEILSNKKNPSFKRF